MTDEMLREKIVGIWAADGICLHGVITNTPDGKSFSRQWVAGTNCNVAVTAYLESKWTIKDGVLIDTVTKSSNTNITPVGGEYRARIIHVDDKQLVTLPLGLSPTSTNVVRRVK
jgi:hypothetical protein